MKELSVQSERPLEEIISLIESKEDHLLFLTYRELQYLHKEVSALANDSALCHLLRLTKIEAYEHLQKIIKLRQTKIKSLKI